MKGSNEREKIILVTILTLKIHQRITEARQARSLDVKYSKRSLSKICV